MISLLFVVRKLLAVNSLVVIF